MNARTPGRRYVLITPCRDEAAFARHTLESVVAQSVPPTLWLIVDDGSTDATPGILAEYAARFDFIRILRRNDRGRRSVGPGVIEAFYAGYNLATSSCSCSAWRGSRAWERAVDSCTIAGGAAVLSARPVATRPPSGFDASKFYRLGCFLQIGGFVREVMWDGLDCHRCRMLGWIACSLDDPELRLIHLRPMGSSDKGILTGRLRSGRGQYFLGTGLAYMTASSLYRMLRPPFVVGGLAMCPIDCICSDPEDVSARYNIPAIPIYSRHRNASRSRAEAPYTNTLVRLLRRVFIRLPQELLHWITAFRTLKGTKMLIMTGTGMLTDFGITPLDLHYEILKWSLAAKLRQCRVVFLSVGGSRLDRPLSRWLVKSALSLADYRSYRDRFSRDCLDSIGVNTRR